MKKLNWAPAAVLALGPLFFSLSAPQSAFAELQHLEGQKAQDYVGNAKEKFTQGGYTYAILTRSHRDAMNGRFSDGLIFTKKTDKFHFRKRSDGDHVVVLGHAEGREQNPVTADAAVWKPIQNVLEDDNPRPNVFLDEKGDELAVVYVGGHTQLEAKVPSDGLLEINVQVPSSVSGIGRARRR